MHIFRGLRHPDIAPGCALTIGNFDGVHRGHQAMLALLRAEARQRGVPSCVMTFEPHPRDYFAAALGKPELAPARVVTLRDKLAELARCGIDQVLVLPFNQRLAGEAASVVITLGAEGAVIAEGADIVRCPGEKVSVVDTTGAGDCFVGTLAAGLARGLPLVEAARVRNAAAALALQGAGAQESYGWENRS